MGYDRPKMPLAERAKQFLPFAAVRGLEEALEQKRQELLFEERIQLATEGESEINQTLGSLENGMRIRVRYYNGSSYEETSGTLLKEDYKKRYLQTEKVLIPFEDITRIDILSE